MSDATMKRGSSLFYIFVLIIISIGNIKYVAASDRGLELGVKTPQGNRIDLYRDSYALIIGNSNYSNGWEPIPGAIRDVKEVAKALEKHGFNITLKTDLTKDGFNRAINEFSLKYGNAEDNRLLFYYAGHGFTRKLATGEELGYLVMVNAPLPEKDAIGFSINSVDMQSLITQAKIILARHVLFMFDSCFSGSIINMRERVVPRSISDSVRYPVRQFITAGRANEPVPDHSVFKQAFLDLIEGRDEEPIPDNYVTGEELGLYLKTKVPQYNPIQHPQYGKIRDPKLDKGDFVFVVKRPEFEQQAIKESQRKEIKSQTTENEIPQLAAIPRQESIAQVSLRRQPMNISNQMKITNMLIEHDFFDSSRNPSGSFVNSFLDNNDGTVTDRTTGLMWQKSGSSSSVENRGAKDYIKQLNRQKFAGYSDWRMPTVDELASLLARRKKDGVHIDPVFDNKQATCWTADECDPKGWIWLAGTWVIDFSRGSILQAEHDNPKRGSTPSGYFPGVNDINYVKAVRSVK
jgi:hypothetical protein